MNNMRIVYDNAADRAALAATSTAGILSANNLLTDRKSQVWRSTGTSASLTITFEQQEMIGMLALAFCSLTKDATIRVRGYGRGQSGLLFDTGTTYVVSNGADGGASAGYLSNTGEAFTLSSSLDPTNHDKVMLVDRTRLAGTPPKLWDWGNVPLNVNAYAHAGAGYAAVWFKNMLLENLTIDINDPTNPLGYIEAGRIVAGEWWSPVNNASVGLQITARDDSKHSRNDAGELMTDRGAQYKAISLNLSLMPDSDRNRVWDMIRGNGMARPVYLSLEPDADDSAAEQTFQLYGKITKNAALTYQYVGATSTALELEEV